MYLFWFNKIVALLFGVVIGVVSLFLNVMMSDSGTKLAHAATQLGLLASLSFIVGGIISCFSTWQEKHLGSFSPYLYLVPGIVLQGLALAICSNNSL